MAHPLRLLAALVLLCGVAAPTFAPSAVAQVGVTSVAVGQPRGTPPARAERVLRVGVDIFASERVSTGTADRAHLVFLDGSAVTVGPNSDLVIDRFVYDPTTRSGDLAMSATRGTFRFVGGAISKRSEVTVRTPGATVGIRGGIVTITIGLDGSVTAIFAFGTAMTVSNPLGSSKAIRPGSSITVPFNGPPLPPVVLPPGTFQAIMGAFEAVFGTATPPTLDDTALLAALQQFLVSPNTDWITVLQTLASQGILVTNSNRGTGASPPITGGGGSGDGGGGGGEGEGGGS
jgi:hypothetical protein